MLYAARTRFARTTARTAISSRSAALTLGESGDAVARSASSMRARRPRVYGLRRAFDQSRTSGISRRDAAVGSFVLEQGIPTVSHLFARRAARSWQKPPARVLP